MDALTRMLVGPRAMGAFVLRSVMDPPWALRVEDEAPLTVVALVRGQAWVIPDREDATLLQTGDVALLKGPDPYVFADEVTTPVQAVISAGQRCSAPDGGPLSEMSEIGVRTWGNNPSGNTVLVTGSYQVSNEVSKRLLDALPSSLVLPATTWNHPLVQYLAEETSRDELGQEALLDRLLDALLIAALRDWFARPEARPPGWYRANADPMVGAALRAMHTDPAHPWTINELASASNASRATFARRFHELVGETPMSFLTGWRLSLAADLLQEPGATVSSVSRAVGYTTPFAFSAAFKRHRGVSPREFVSSRQDDVRSSSEATSAL